MGIATLGFAGGPQVAFRIDPDSISWNFQINTSVINTLGGRVVQVLGATLSDITVAGSYGEDHTKGAAAKGIVDHPGRSWRLAEAFAAKVRDMQQHQVDYSLLTPVRRKTAAPAIFHYAPKGWRFNVYIKSIIDPTAGNNAISHSQGKFAYQYQLALFVEQDASGQLVRAGTSNGVIDAKKQQAIEAYIARISDGIGWTATAFNGPNAMTAANLANNDIVKNKG